MRRRFAALGILSLLLAALAVGYVSTQLRDLPDPRDGDLSVHRLPDLPPEQNAFVQLVLLGERLPLEIDDAVDLRHALAAGALDTWRDRIAGVRTTLAGLPDALAPSEAQAPLSAPIWSDDPNRMAALRGLERISLMLGSRARLQAEDGNCTAALDDVGLALAVAARLRSARGADLIHVMTAHSHQDVALSAGDAVLGVCALSAGEARAWQARVDAYRSTPRSWADALRTEYQFMKEAILSAAEPGAIGQPVDVTDLFPDAYLLHLNRTLSELAPLYRRAGGWSCAARPSSESIEDPTQISLLGPNGVGRVLASVAAPDFSRYHRRLCEGLSHLEAHRVFAALRAYQGTHGELPESLDALVPDYAEVLPVDPFSELPLGYSRAERRVSGFAIPF